MNDKQYKILHDKIEALKKYLKVEFVEYKLKKGGTEVVCVKERNCKK